LRLGSAECSGWWETHDVHATVSGRKRLHPPAGEPQEYEVASFQANDDLALKLAIYTPV
jgi:MmyB-like transcription regulator ligand binding domain